MDLGKKLLSARQEAGLSQRQLCGETITRNMLSQIEHGTAKPSMETLRYLAGRLGKPVSYFLEEETVVSANQQVMTAIRKAFDGDEPEAVLELLEDYRGPDEVYDRELSVMACQALLSLAERAAAQGREPHARALAERAEAMEDVFCSAPLRERRLQLLGSLQGTDLKRMEASLESLDGALLLRARCAAARGDHSRALQLLSAMEDQTSPEQNLLRGQALLGLERYEEAVPCLESALESRPMAAARALEECYRSLGDYQKAYYYACKTRKE